MALTQLMAAKNIRVAARFLT